MDSIQDFSKVELTLDNPIIPNERLRSTPSARDGCPHELEVDLRIVGCEYIQTAGVLLRLPQVAMATAQVLFQRFFYSKSLLKYNMVHVAMACIFLAAKIEENCRRVRDIANVFHHLKQKRMGRPVVPMEYLGEEYFKLKASIIKYERFLLRDLGFCVHVRHPHKLIIAYLQILELEKNKQLAQKSWNCMNDSLRTNVFVRFSPETIACACIFLSARQLKVGLPQKPPWWTVFDVRYEDIEAISLEVVALYQRPRAFLLDLDKKLNVLREDFAKKQVEVKEVTLKKSSKSAATSPSSKQQHDSEGQKKEKESSPATISPLVQSNKLQPSPLSQSHLHNQSQKKHPSLSNNHHSVSPPPTSSLSLSRKSRPAPSQPPHPLKRRKTSPIFNQAHSPPNRKGNSDTLPAKTIISPIRLASSGDSYSDTPPPSPRENGLPKQYRRNFNKNYRQNRHDHHHRSGKSSQEKHRHRHSRQDGGVHGNRRGHDRPKSRRTEHDHLR